MVAPANMPFLVPIVFGDWSNDGHNESSRMYVFSTHDIAAWRKALADGNQAVGVNLGEICSGYGDRTVDPTVLETLRLAGWEGKYDEYDLRGGKTRFNTGIFQDLFFFLIGKGNPDIQYIPIEAGSHRMEVHPGGYGLFGEEKMDPSDYYVEED